VTVARRFSRYQKMTPALEALLVEQIKPRRKIRSWAFIADQAGISRQNLFYHVKRLERQAQCRGGRHD